jgi:hypothetical protein
MHLRSSPFMIDGGAVLQGIDASLTSTACSRKHNDVFRACSAQVSCGAAFQLSSMAPVLQPTRRSSVCRSRDVAGDLVT